jgi:carboxylesterase type B
LDDFCAPESNQVEDCLFLNVYTPTDATSQSNLPVLVFIHGGAFVFGCSTSPVYEGSYLAHDSNIVVVTINYRLGALGFLVLGDEVDGNFGIKDQRLALEWVQENIRNFGGNPGAVTLSGDSAGASSVAIHMTSNKSRGLFHKAIIQSNPFGFEYRTAEAERILGIASAAKLFCFGLFQSRLDCLRQKKLEDIVYRRYNPSLLQFIIEPGINLWKEVSPWAPVIDGDELTDQPFKNNDFIQVPTIMGTTSAEGILFIYSGLKFPLPATLYSTIMLVLFKGNVDYLEQYPPKPSDDNRPQLSEAFEDYIFVCSTLQAAKSVAEFAPVYSYIFDHPFPCSGPHCDAQSLCRTNACHAAELPYVFHTLEDMYSGHDEELADTVSRYWGNFVNTGNPNMSPSFMNIERYLDVQADVESQLPVWPQYTAADNWPIFVMAPDNFQTKLWSAEQCQLYEETSLSSLL